MKFTIDIDCTPQEARTFLGLPDVTQLNETMLKEFENRMRETLGTMEPDALFTMMSKGMQGMPDLPGMPDMPDMPESLKGLEAMQKSFWSQMMTMAGNSTDKSGDDK